MCYNRDYGWSRDIRNECGYRLRVIILLRIIRTTVGGVKVLFENRIQRRKPRAEKTFKRASRAES
jgi:hypothetical protein